MEACSDSCVLPLCVLACLAASSTTDRLVWWLFESVDDWLANRRGLRTSVTSHTCQGMACYALVNGPHPPAPPSQFSSQNNYKCRHTLGPVHVCTSGRWTDTLTNSKNTQLFVALGPHSPSSSPTHTCGGCVHIHTHPPSDKQTIKQYVKYINRHVPPSYYMCRPQYKFIYKSLTENHIL